MRAVQPVWEESKGQHTLDYDNVFNFVSVGYGLSKRGKIVTRNVQFWYAPQTLSIGVQRVPTSVSIILHPQQWCSYTRAHTGPGSGEFLNALVNHVRSTYLNSVA